MRETALSFRRCEDDMKKQTPETGIKKQCIDYMGAKGYFPISFPASTYGRKGKPDTLFVKKGFNWDKKEISGFERSLCSIYFIEFKSPTGELSTAQEKVQFDMTARGLPYFVVRSLDEMRDIVEGK